MKIICHVDNELCRQFKFRPINENLAPTYYFERIAKHQPDLRSEFAALGTIPGTYIAVDCPGLENGKPDVSKAVGYVGSLIDDAKWAEIQRVYRESVSDMPMGKCGARPEERSWNLDTLDELATWLFWIARGVERRSIKRVKGEIPTIDQIRRLGDVRTNDLLNLQPKSGAAPVDHLPKIVDGVKETVKA